MSTTMGEKFSHRFLNYKALEESSFKFCESLTLNIFFLNIFSLLPGLFGQLTGINFESLWGRIGFVFFIFISMLFFAIAIRFIYLTRKQEVFLSPKWVFLFALDFFLIWLGSSLCAFLTTSYKIEQRDGKTVGITSVNALYFFTIVFPIYIANLIFVYYAFYRKIIETDSKKRKEIRNSNK